MTEPAYSDQSYYAWYPWGQRPPATSTCHCRWCRVPFAVQNQASCFNHTCACGGVTLVSVNIGIEVEETAVPQSSEAKDG
jgi:hypothetical protein